MATSPRRAAGALETGSMAPVDQREPRRVAEPQAWRWLTPGTALTSLVVFAVGSASPAYWFDEAVTLHATRRSWIELLLLFKGDPSLLPYYLVIKPFAVVSEAETWLRLPGEIAAATAVALLVAGVQRVFGNWPALLCGATLLAIPSVSLYAQMIRPYPFLVFLVVACTIAWWRSLSSDRRLWSIVYGVAYVCVGLAHIYALTLVIPLIISGWLVPEGSRARTTRRTILPALLAIAVLSPFLVLNALLAPGPWLVGDLSPTAIGQVLANAIGTPVQATTLLVLAILGLICAPRAVEAQRRLSLLAATWAFGLPIVLVTAQAAGARTLVSRYFLFTVPALAVLAGLGLWRLGRWWRPMAVVGLATVVALGLPRQVQARSEGGHNAGPVRFVATTVELPALRNLPVIANPKRFTLSRLAAYAPDVIADRMPLNVDRSTVGEWRMRSLRAGRASAALAAYAAVIVVRLSVSEPAPLQSRETDALLSANGFTQRWAECSLEGTSVEVLARPARAGELARPETIIDQVHESTPKAVCRLG